LIGKGYQTLQAKAELAGFGLQIISPVKLGQIDLSLFCHGRFRMFDFIRDQGGWKVLTY